MRKIYLLLPLIFSFAILSCPKEPEPEPPPTLDQRLVGGRWYFWKIPNTSQPKTENGYYEFKNEFTLIHCDKSNKKTEHSVYTKNNIVYWKDNDQELFKYQFYDKFPYQDIPLSPASIRALDRAAANNHIITCDVIFNIFELTDNDTNTDYRWKIICRFHEDLTVYQ
jgi:hypothetical protein